MASPTTPQPTSKKVAPTKLPRLPKRNTSPLRYRFGVLSLISDIPPDAHIQKRAIVRPPIPSPYANSSKQKVVYVSTHTPFIPAVKRVRGLLEQAEKRAVGPLNLLQGSKGNDRQKLRKLTESVEKTKDGKAKEEVVLKATGRAIERVLSFGLYFQGQADCVVRIRTGGIGVVDDIVAGDTEDDAEGEAGELPETRVRRTSVVEVAVTLK